MNHLNDHSKVRAWGFDPSNPDVCQECDGTDPECECQADKEDMRERAAEQRREGL